MPKKHNPLTYGEVRRMIHRLNERIRYTTKRYGKSSAVTTELVNTANRLVKGTGVSLKRRKDGTMNIPETESSINNIISHNLKGMQSDVWRASAKATTPKDVFKKLRSAYGKIKGKVSKQQEAKFLTQQKGKYDMANKIINKLMDSGVLGSDEVNAIFRDRVTGRRKLIEWLENHPHFNENNVEDLRELGEYLMGVSSQNSGENVSYKWGVDADNTPSADFISDMTGKPKARKYKTSKAQNPFGEVSSPSFVKPLGGWTKF